MFILDRPSLVSTVLGSCVAVTLFNARRELAAICHALLPSCKKRIYVDSVHDLLDEDCIQCPESYRYVDCAVAMMAEAFRRCGIAPGETQVQLLGGARMIGDAAGAVRTAPVGQQNVKVARKVLADHHLRIAFSDTGGAAGRKIIFDSQTGDVAVSRIGRINVLPAKPRFEMFSGRLL